MNAFMEQSKIVTNNVNQMTKSVTQSVITNTVQDSKLGTSAVYKATSEAVKETYEVTKEVVTFPLTALKAIGELLQNANYHQQYAYHNM